MTPIRRIAWLFSLLLLLGGTAWAKEWDTYPASGTQPFLGLDDTSAPTQVQDGRASDIQNVALDISKSARKRFGYSLVGQTMDITGEDNCAVTGLYYTKFSSGTERIVATCGGRFHYLNGTTWTEVTNLTVAITAGNTNQFVWTTALDTIVGTNGVDPPLTYDGTSLSTVNFASLSSASRPSTAKVVAFFKNYLIVGNTTEGGVNFPTRIRWSNVGVVGTWTDEDLIDLGALGGQSITAMAELYDNLYVFLTDSIYRVSYVAGANTYQISKVTDDIGCIAKNGVQSIMLTNAQNGLIFLDKEKRVYFFDGIAVHDIGPLITQTLSDLSAARLQYAVSGDTGTDYLLCATNGAAGLNNLCLDFQYQLGEWTKHSTIPANAMANVLDANGRAQIYFGSEESFTYQWANTSLIDDVATATGTVSVVNTYDTTTASGLQVLYDNTAVYTASGLIGAPIVITGGDATGLVSTVADNTTTGVVVTDAFSTTPSVGVTYEVGAINSFYTTKWYDMGEAARLKHYGEVYFWADAKTGSTLSVSSGTDFNADITTESISLTSSTNDAIWGSAIWGTSLWGSASPIFRQVKLDSQGRYLRVKYADDDPNETWHLFGWTVLKRSGDLN